MKPSELAVDTELKSLISGHILAGTTPVPVYANGEMPTGSLPDDFIEILYNGAVDSLTENHVVGRGYMAVAMSNKLYENGTVKIKRVKKLLEQFEGLVDKASSSHYFFKLTPDGFITPTTASQTSGYSHTILNVEWRTK